MSGTLTLVFGPMFSGKTTQLINIYKYKCLEYNNEKCLALNYALDNRYGNNKIVTHNKESIPCYNIYSINDFIENSETNIIFLKAKYIFINEAQFFENLIHDVLNIKHIYKKHIILCGLDLDFECKKFGQLSDLSMYANKVTYLHGTCNTNGCIYPSIYSHRITKNKEQLLIGTNEYIPLCKFCYDEVNKNTINK